MKPTKYEPMKLLKSMYVKQEFDMSMKHLPSVRSAITRIHKARNQSLNDMYENKPKSPTFTTKKVSDKLFILRREK